MTFLWVGDREEAESTGEFMRAAKKLLAETLLNSDSCSPYCIQ